MTVTVAVTAVDPASVTVTTADPAPSDTLYVPALSCTVGAGSFSTIVTSALDGFPSVGAWVTYALGSCIGLAIFLPFGIVTTGTDWLAVVSAAPLLVAKLAVGGAGLAVIETLSAKMRIFRAPEFLGAAFLLAVLGMLIHFLLES